MQPQIQDGHKPSSPGGWVVATQSTAGKGQDLPRSLVPRSKVTAADLAANCSRSNLLWGSLLAVLPQWTAVFPLGLKHVSQAPVAGISAGGASCD